MVEKLIITIDGPSGAGKSTVAHILAQKLNYKYIDTGALYRVVALKLKEGNINPESEEGLRTVCCRLDVSFSQRDGQIKVFSQGKDITEDIRAPEISLLASKVSAHKLVRDALLTVQRKLAQGGGVVVEGRDMGTVVFPRAEVKFFLDASLGVRGERRFKQYLEKGQVFDRSRITSEIEKRDAADSRRALAPLTPADDATVIDSTTIGIEEVVEAMVKVVSHRLPSSSK